MKRFIFSWMWVLVFLTACGSAETPTPTPVQVDGAGEAAVEMIQQEMYSRLTQQAVENDRIEAGARATATQQIMDATATQARYLADARETQRADSATQQAWQVTVAAAQAHETATAQAAAAGTQQALVNLAQTQEARATATQFAVLARQTETSVQQTQEAPMIAARLEALEIEKEKARIDLQRARDTYFLQTYCVYGLGLALVAAGGFVLWKKSQVGVIMDENGRVRVVMIKNQALRPELMSQAVIDFSQKRAQVPDLGSSAEMQLQLAHERNMVDAIDALPPGYPRQAMGMLGSLSTPQAGTNFNIQVVQPNAVQPWLEDVQGQLAQGAEEDG